MSFLLAIPFAAIVITNELAKKELISSPAVSAIEAPQSNSAPPARVEIRQPTDKDQNVEVAKSEITSTDGTPVPRAMFEETGLMAPEKKGWAQDEKVKMLRDGDPDPSWMK
jgi:hypothetical protein